MPPSQQHPLALAIEWVAKITTVALEMVLPGLGGLWLDKQWGTPFLGLAGFALGLTVGIWHLLRMVPKNKSNSRKQDQPPESPS
jgi:hypothetical protein